MDDLDQRLEWARRAKELQDGLKSGEPQVSVADSISNSIPDAVKNIGTAAYKGVLGLPALAGQGLLNINRQERQWNNDLFDTIFRTQSPEATAPDIMKMLNESGYQPKTTSEKYVNAGMQGAAGMVGPGLIANPVKALITGGVAGLSGEAAGQVTAGTKLEPYARVVGALVGGGLTGVGLTRVKNAQDVTQKAFHSWTAEDYNRAAKEMETAGKSAVPIKLNVAQAVGRPTDVDNLVEALVTREQGRPLIDQLRAQPQQAYNLADKLKTDLPGSVQEPITLSNAAQKAATETYQAAKNYRTAKVRPLYEAAGTVPESFLQKVHGELGKAIEVAPDTAKGELLADLQQIFTNALKRGKGENSPILQASGQAFGGAEKAIPMTELNDSMRSLTTSMKSLNASTKAGDKEAVGNLLASVKDIRNAMGEVSPQFKAGNKLYEEISRTFVDDLRKGVTGRVAGVTGALADKEAVNRLLPILEKGRNPNAKTSDILRYATETKAYPEQFRDAVKTHFSNAVESIEKAAKGQPVENFAEQLKKKLFATPSQRQGLADALDGIAWQTGDTSGKLKAGFMAGLRLLEAASKRPMNLGISPNDFENLAGASKLASGLQLLSLNAGNQAGKGFHGYVTGKTYKELAENLTTEEGLRRIEKMAKVPIMSRAAQVIMNSLAGSYGQTMGGVQQSNTVGNEEN